jgi:hypothetical protein
LTIGNELTKTVRRGVSKFPFAFTPRERTGFRGIKSDKAIRLPIGANRIAIDDRDWERMSRYRRAGINPRL